MGASEDLYAVEALQWAPDGNALSGIPGHVSIFLAGDDGKTRGYGYGPGWSMIFQSEQGDISVDPGEWLVRLSNGAVVVEAEEPEVARIFDAADRAAEIEFLRRLTAAAIILDDWGNAIGI